MSTWPRSEANSSAVLPYCGYKHSPSQARKLRTPTLRTPSRIAIVTLPAGHLTRPRPMR